MKFLQSRQMDIGTSLGALGFLQNEHKLDWTRHNYEIDPDVGLKSHRSTCDKFYCKVRE
jgi:hypothetical protein